MDQPAMSWPTFSANRHPIELHLSDPTRHTAVPLKWIPDKWEIISQWNHQVLEPEVFGREAGRKRRCEEDLTAPPYLSAADFFGRDPSSGA
jgi:hypothetical protein